MTMEHGTVVGYNRGCRCEPCHEAVRAYWRQRANKRYRIERLDRARSLPQPDKDRLRERLSELVVELRDDPIKLAVEIEEAIRKAVRPARPARWQHGKVSGYASYGCRCDKCSAAYSAYRKARRSN